MKPPSYLELIARMWRDGAIPRGQAVHIDIAHDADCSLLRGLLVCDCRPMVTVLDPENLTRKVGDGGYGDTDGNGVHSASHISGKVSDDYELIERAAIAEEGAA